MGTKRYGIPNHRLILALAWVGLTALGAVAQWADAIVLTQEPDAGEAISRLAAGEIDVYALSISDLALFGQLQATPDLKAYLSFGSSRDLMMNHSGDQMFFTDGRLNPFGDPRIREAMHWLICRDHIAQEIAGGLGVPKYTYINPAFPDGRRYADLIAAMEVKYSCDLAMADQIITARMTAHGAIKIADRWTYNGEVVELRFLIRIEDERKGVGDYIADRLEEVGFTVIRHYGMLSDLTPFWLSSDPLEGQWHLYTGGWRTPAIPCDMGCGFDQFYTSRRLSAWRIFGTLATETTDPCLWYVVDRLCRRDYTTMDAREVLFDLAVRRANAYANLIWLVDQMEFSPVRASVALAADLAGGILHSHIWAHTLQFQVRDEPLVGGTVHVAVPSLLVGPWNPIAGSNSEFDAFPIRATSDCGTFPDTQSSLVWPNQIERAEVYVLEGIPIEKDPASAWLTVHVVPSIAVPADAWVDWDAVEQRFITAGEKHPGGLTAKRKSVVYYPKSLYDVPLHDGSTISIGDFVLHMILQFDRAKPESPIYDESVVAAHSRFMTSFRGVRILSRDPLIIESYSDTLPCIDATLFIDTWFPCYAQGPGFWHVLTPGILAEHDRSMGFSKAKAGLLGVPWTDLIAEPSLSILAMYLDQATLTGYIPYAPTLGEYITPDEACERFGNLQAWYASRGHFWVANGPYYLDRFCADDEDKHILLRLFADYRFSGERMQFLVD